MKTITTTLTTNAVFSEDETRRYLLQKIWDAEKPRLAIIMLAPSEASGIALDSTTLLVLNNAARLGYGSVAILNLFAVLDDFGLKHAEDRDDENLQMILSMAEQADAVVYAPGVGKAGNKMFRQRQEQVLSALTPFEGKLFCLCNERGTARLQHPLSPAVRVWKLSPFKTEELLPEELQEAAAEASQATEVKQEAPLQKKTDKPKGRPRKTA